MAEKDRDMSMLATLTGSFNPHHTGEWLKSGEGATPPTTSKAFQSSSYWRMAEKFGNITVDAVARMFQSSSYWRMAEKSWPATPTNLIWVFQSSSYWRMAEKTGTASKSAINSHLFQSSSYWRMAEKLLPKSTLFGKTCFNPHHTGEWLKSHAGTDMEPRMDIVSILIILANGWKVR